MGSFNNQISNLLPTPPFKTKITVLIHSKKTRIHGLLGKSGGQNAVSHNIIAASVVSEKTTGRNIFSK